MLLFWSGQFFFIMFLYVIFLYFITVFCRYIDPYRDLNHTVRFVTAMIGERDGVVQVPITDRNGISEIVISGDSRNSQLQKNQNLDTQRSASKKPHIKVQSMTVKTLVQDLHIPQFFGVLSIDTKGVGDRVGIPQFWSAFN